MENVERRRRNDRKNGNVITRWKGAIDGRIDDYRYGSELMVVESYSENNMSASMIGRHLDRYWLGLASLDDLRTNTLESAAGMLVSQYAGL